MLSCEVTIRPELMLCSALWTQLETGAPAQHREQQHHPPHRALHSAVDLCSCHKCSQVMSADSCVVLIIKCDINSKHCVVKVAGDMLLLTETKRVREEVFH